MEETKLEKEVSKEPKRLQDAKADFEKMQKEIAPFLKNRKYRRYVADEQWCETASLCK
jgi:hypothetical protein